MFLDDFHARAGDLVQVSADQASRFAKRIAGDFNPIHDPDAKRFCVPGDLLFALVLRYYGLSERMEFAFRGMVGADVALRFAKTDADSLDIADAAGKVYLHVERRGASTRDSAMIDAITRQYVAFSGHNFPHLLQPLMAEQQVMFNPDRPLVIYDSMSFQLDRLDAVEPRMALDTARLDVTGKRGDTLLEFGIHARNDGIDEVIGKGSKKLVVSSLRPYDDQRMQEVIAEFNRRKAAG